MASGSTDQTLLTATPLKVYLRDHFTAVLQRSRPTRQHQKGQVKPRQYGEVLTADEVYERIEEEKKKKEISKQRRGQLQRKAQQPRTAQWLNMHTPNGKP